VKERMRGRRRSRRRRRRKRRRRRRRSGGIQNQKQEPHTKMWGNTKLL